MDLTLKRDEFISSGIFSSLYQLGGPTLFKTVEHAYQSPSGLWLPKIKPGVYTCLRGEHQLAHGPKFITFEVMGVPNHKGIVFHKGNFGEKDSDGCILLGLKVVGAPGTRMITQSQIAYERFMALQKGVDDFLLTVIGG